MKQFYVTTPIYYANDVPHAGHAYTTLAADVLARYWRAKLGSDQVMFLTGTDEHGQKIADAAARANLSPKAFVDTLVPRFTHAWEALNIVPTVFMRTTYREHIVYAQEYLKTLKAAGWIYTGEYDGLYCIGCEEYKTETDLAEGVCPLHPNLTPEHRHETNEFFKFTAFAPKVADAIESGALVVEPEARRNEVLTRLRGELRDLSISRPGLSWGVPLPWDESQTVYVWVEALLNYASALERQYEAGFWPPTIQLMAKDILWFHAAIWPALLLAGGKPLPQRVFAHGFFTVDGQKMSKTVGNVIDPVALVEEWGTDAVRYFLLSAVPFGADGDLQPSRWHEIYAADLANTLGNLLQRVVTMLGRAQFEITPNPTPRCLGVETAIEQLKLDEGLKVVIQVARDANRDLEQAKPWELIKDETERTKLETVLTKAYRQLETIAVGLAPYLPTTAERIVEQLRSGSPAPLFPRKD